MLQELILKLRIDKANSIRMKSGKMFNGKTIDNIKEIRYNDKYYTEVEFTDKSKMYLQSADPYGGIDIYADIKDLW